MLVDLHIQYKTNWHRETGNTGINTPEKISDTWRGWRQSQGQVKQIRACQKQMDRQKQRKALGYVLNSPTVGLKYHSQLT